MTISAEPAPPLALSLFGPFRLQVNGAPLPRLGAWRQQEAILALLVLRHPRPVERCWLAGCLWPECAESQGLATLRRYLTDLRRALGPEAARLLSPSASSLALDLTGAAIDLLAFDAALARGDAPSLEEAVALYRGPLLEGWTEEWVFQERQAREQAFLRALEALAECAMVCGEWATAEGYLRQAVGVDPLRESAHRALMQVLAAGGNYAAALLCYRELRQYLHRELNTEPDAETQTVFQQLRTEARRLSSKGPGIAVHGSAFSPSRSLEGLAHNLPAPLTSFVGREKQMTEVKELLATTRLLTLTGSGGCGKTRLALQAAADLLEEYKDGVWLVELAPLADPALVPQTIASALGVREEPGRPLTATLADHLRPKWLLLVLDNCEHLVEACARLVETLLQRCPQLRVLATSREALAIAGETAYRVPSLSVPGAEAFGRSGRIHGDEQDEQDGEAPDMSRYPVHPANPVHPVNAGPTPEGLNAQTPEHVMQSEAVRLFVARASAVLSAFRLTDENAPAVAEVCRRLEGIPLAIELAAAQVRVLPVEQIASRLDDALRLLTRGSRTALPRHRTLRALIDWSHALLSEAERVLLRRLSVFSGGWTLEAAEGVAALQGMSSGGAPVGGAQSGTGVGGQGSQRGLAGSDLTPGPWPPAPHDVLDLVTALVDKSLVQFEAREPGAREAGGGRYGLLETVRQYGRERLVESGEAEAVRRQHAQFFLAWVEAGVGFERLEEEHSNLRAALGWMAEAGEAELGLRLAVALEQFWMRRSYLSEAREQLERLLALPRARENEELRGRAITAAGCFARTQGDNRATRALFEECLAIQSARGDKTGMAGSYLGLGLLARDFLADYEQARSLYERSLALYRELGSKERVAQVLNDLGYAAYLQGDYQRAWALLHESLAARRELDDSYLIGWTVTHLAEVADVLGDAESATAFLEEGFAIWHQLRYNYAIAWTLRKQGRIEQHGGRWEVARRCFAASLALCRDQGVPWGAAECLEGLAEAAAEEGCWERACRLFGAAEALRERGGWPLPPAYRSDHEQGVAAARGSLGEAGAGARSAGNRSAATQGGGRFGREADGAGGRAPGFAAAWAEGRAMPLPEAIAYALELSSPA